MATVIKDKDGNLIVRPISHVATDKQVKSQLQALIDDGQLVNQEIYNNTYNQTISISQSDISARDAIINSIDIEYGRINKEASYYFLRIPKYDINGNKITPKVALTSSDGEPKSPKMSAMNYAKTKGLAICCNAGLFNTGSRTSSRKQWPEGPLVIDGIDKTIYKVTAEYTGDKSEFNYYTDVTSTDKDYGGSYYVQTNSSGVQVTSYPWMVSDMGTKISSTECYPLLIDANGDFCTLSSEDRKSDDYLPSNLMAAGYKYVVCGWGRLVYNYLDDSLSSDEIVHGGKYIRQLVGQFQNGDYFIMSVDKTGYSGATAPKVNEAGASYADLAQLLIGKGVKFAYSLDGGGSCETVLGNRHVNPIFDGTDGRAVPTVIYWSKD